MKAIAPGGGGPGEVLQLQEVARPTPKDREVLIRILTTIAMAADAQPRSSKPPAAFSLFSPKQPGHVIPGQDLAGEIEAIGRTVTRFRKGDQVIDH